MSRRTLSIDDALYDYLSGISVRESDTLRALREETLALPMAQMQISPEQGQFMALLVRLMGAKRIIEVGTFTGYSALWMADALPPDGRIIACDLNEEWTGIGERYWRRAGVEDRIELRLAPALETLNRLITGGGEGQYDFAFIDAEKQEYGAYFERLLTLVRPGGLIAVDNVLWGGSVADPAKNDADTRAIRAFNAALREDERVDISLVPIGDGVTLALKR